MFGRVWGEMGSFFGGAFGWNGLRASFLILVDDTCLLR